ncbi:hypothetical protein CsatB_006447 [Cannabis sativa]
MMRFLLLVIVTWILMMMIPCMAQNDTTSVKVGVVLDMETQMGKIWLSCIELGLSDFYNSHPHFKTRLILNIRDSKEDVVTAASQALDLIKNVQVKAILGPHSSSQAKFIIDLGQKAQVPIISFSATSPSLIPSQNSYFFQTAISDSSQVKAINSIVKLFGWRKVVPIYTANEYGEGIIPYLVDALGEIDVRVPYRSVIPPLATDDQIKFELYKLNAMQTRVFVVHMSYNLGLKLFSIAKKIGMLERGYVWIITQDFTNLLGSSLEYSSNIFSSMEGVLGIKTFVPQSKELDNLKIRWKAKFYKDNNLNNFFDATKLNVMGYWAYDSVRALALAVEKIGSSIVNNDAKLNNVTTGGSTDLDSFGVSKIGPKLLETLSGTRFEGIAGNFSLDNGQLETLTFQIVNIVNGGGEREIGFWIQKLGLVRTLLNSSESNLGPIIWPGESTLPPKGWDFATNGKRLRIGIPVKSGFNEFVKVVNYDSSTNISDATGFTIDVFKAVVKVLPYALLYDFFPCVKDDGESAGTYDDLVYQVYLGKYDAVVADSTIRANRSKYVDFTLPYTMESGVAMVVPMEDNKRKSAWIFIKPLTWDLWIAILCFFLFIGFVVWVLEHRINEDFRGPPSHQIGTSFWFSFSTMVFAHKERVISNLARFVLIIWVFVIFILTQSYTASLTSLLTVQQLQPTISDINQLLKSGQRVGYLGNSFVYGLLRQTGFPASQIVAFDSAEECDQFLTMGNAKGGVAAVVEETPNMKPFLAQYCNKYTMIGPIFKTDGFGFVFPKGSPLVGDVSSAILNVTEGDEMNKIERKWFKNEQNTCSNSDPKTSSNNLSLSNFWGLFLIAGVSSLFALIIFAIMFLHKHKQVLLDSNVSLGKKIEVIFENFDQKDLSSHTFRKNNNQPNNGYDTDVVEIITSTNNTNCPPSPSTTNYTIPNSPASM